MVGGQPAEVLEAPGRLIVTPHPVLLDGQRNVPAEFYPGESLGDFLARHVTGIDSGAWIVTIGGYEVPRAMWRRTYPKHGQLISCRCAVQKSAVALVAMAALAYFTLGSGWTLGATLLGINGLAAVGATGAFMLNAGIFFAGALVINKVLAPKIPGAPGSPQSGGEVYSLRSQRNTARPYAPIGTLLGEMRVTPDLASQSYTWFEGDDQYLSTILLGGINVASYADLTVGDTPLSSYSDVTVYTNGFSGMASQDVPLFSNADSVAGATLEDTTAWVTRTSSVDTVMLQLDFEYQLYHQRGEGISILGIMGGPALTIAAEYRAVGSPTWLPLRTETYRNQTTEVRRVTWSQSVPKGQYEVRARRTQGPNEENITRTVQWATLRSVQPDETDYSGWGRIGIRIRATGQLNGSLDTLRATFKPRPLPVWNGSAWVNATTRAEGISNPGAIILQVLRGIWHGGVLQFGYGLDDEQIDVEGLKGFMLHCAASGFTYDRWITENISLGALLEEIALAGMGQFMWLDGSRPTVMWAADDQPLGGVVNMANMTRGSFSVGYQLAEAADGIEYQYVDRARNYETVTLRVMAPGVTTMLKPARVTGQGVTTEAHAAMLARYHLAQSLYQYKDISFGADLERLDYRRLSMLSLSHDMTQWGYGGRLAGAEIVGGQIVLTLDEPVPSLPSRFVGLRVPGEQSYRVFGVQAFTGPSNVITLTGTWPAGVPFPGDTADNPAHDTLWCYDVKATPGYRVRVVSIEPDSDLKGATVRVVPEGDEFWDYVLTGDYVPAPSESLIPELERPAVLNIRVQQQVNRQGDTEWVQLNVVWDSTGDLSHCQVWAAIDGEPLRMVDGQAVGNRSSFRIDINAEWLIQVRPFDTSGRPGASGSVLFVADAVNRVPANVDVFDVSEVDGGLRRYRFGYNVVKQPAAYSGVQIRYRAGSTPVTVGDWDSLTPLGQATDIYTQAAESTLPAAGTWTFACRAITTAGVLSGTVAQVTRTLAGTFSDIISPDLVPPPTPTGGSITAGFAKLIVTHDVPTYTQGHGHDKTRVYGVVYTGGALPVFSAATLLGEFSGEIGQVPAELGKTYRIWLKWVTRDGVESTTPAGGTNGFAATTGKVGNSDLNDLIIDAAKLQDGSVSAAKVAANAIDLTKFASGIEPVTVVMGSLPTTKSTNTIFLASDGKLYRWNGSAYTAAVLTSDLSGTIADAQIAGLAASKVTGTLTDEQLAGISAAKITGQITATQITDGAISTPKLAAGAVTAANIAADTITAAQIAAGAITSTELAAGAVVAGKIAAGTIQAADIAAGTITGDRLAANTVTASQIAANTITAGQIAAGAIGADQIAANAITTGKLLVTGQGAALNDDPNTQDASAWSGSTHTVLQDSQAPNGRAIQVTSTGLTTYNGRLIPIDGSKNYLLRVHAMQASGASTCYLGVAFYDAAGSHIDGANDPASWPSVGTFHYFGLVGNQPPAVYTSYQVAFGPAETARIPAAARYVRPIFLANYTGSGAQRFASIVLAEKAGADLIVDGAIVAGKIAAGAIAVGSAAIADGAIRNALIENAAIDNAKIANVSAAKITAGSIAVGQHIQSSNYVAGASGWRVNGDGFAEFGAASIRGQLTASQIDSRGLSIKDASGNVILAAGSPLAASNIIPAAGWLNSNAGATNQVDTSWWKQDASIPWPVNGEYNRLVNTSPSGGADLSIPGPKGSNDCVWYCKEVSNNGESGGGWDSPFFDLDPTKAYRFVVPIRRLSGVASSYWGTNNVCDLNTTTVNGNPYFAAVGAGALQADRWYLFVGYVYPAGTTQNTNDSAGIWDCKTGQKVAGGYNFCFRPADGSVRHRAYQYYASNGAEQVFGRPMINIVDGAEPSLREFFEAGALLNASITVSAGQLQGIGTPGVMVDNNNIGINSGGQFYGGGAGTGIVVSNNQLSLGSDGALYSAGTYLGQTTLGGLGAGAMAYINQITSANVSSYIASAAINLANINVASINTLAALSSILGTVDIVDGGYLRSGQTSWSTGSGFWLGWIGSGPGEPGFSIGSSSAYLRYKPSTGLEIKLDPIIVTLSTTYIYYSALGAPFGYTSPLITSSVSGGTAPYTYQWTLSPGPMNSTSLVNLVGDPSGTSIEVAGQVSEIAGSASAYYTLRVTDANGRSGSATGYFEIVEESP